MLLPAVLKSYIEQALGGIKITNVTAVSGGNINQVYCLQTNGGKYLIKLNSKSKYPGMFACEAAGLQVIADTKTIATPSVVLQGDVDDTAFLLLDWIDSQRPIPATSHLLGQQLALMHSPIRPLKGELTVKGTNLFGLDADNYMGSLRQSNKKHATWADFYINERLIPMVKIAASKRLLNTTDEWDFEKLYNKLPGLFDEEPPALIHGDLWGGNYLINANGTPYLIDPAISYGHREFDIAMTTLFGGFSPEFYQGYNGQYPLAKGWEQRLDLWNLYPLLLHLNLFGAGYLGQARGCLRTYL